MSITIVKRSGIKNPTEFMLKKCITLNNKNIGFAYARDGKIIINKNFKDENTFFASWNISNITESDSAIIFCCNDEKINEPIPFTNKKDLMKNVLVECQCPVLAHDGELRYKKDISNFEDFICEVFDMNIDKFKPIVNMCFEDMKVVILHSNKEVELFGNWLNESGLLYSNGMYRKSQKKINKLLKLNNIKKA